MEDKNIMMKRNLTKFGIFISAGLLTLAMMGCSSTTSAKEATGVPEAVSEAPTDMPADMPSEAPTDEPAAEEKETLAKIVSIDGETITLAAFGNDNRGGRGKGKAAEGETVSEEAAEGGQAPEGGAPNGEKPDGEAPAGGAPNGEKPDGQAPNGQAPNGEAPNGEKPDGQEENGETLELTLTDATEYKDCTIDDLEADTLVRVSYNEDNEVVSISLADMDNLPTEEATETE